MAQAQHSTSAFKIKLWVRVKHRPTSQGTSCSPEAHGTLAVPAHGRIHSLVVLSVGPRGDSLSKLLSAVVKIQINTDVCHPSPELHSMRGKPAHAFTQGALLSKRTEGPPFQVFGARMLRMFANGRTRTGPRNALATKPITRPHEFAVSKQAWKCLVRALFGRNFEICFGNLIVFLMLNRHRRQKSCTDGNAMTA